MWKSYALLILATILFSGNFIVGKVATESIPPFTLAFMRSMIAFLVLFCIGFKDWKRHKNYLFRQWKPLYGMALTGIVLFPGLVYTSLNYTTTINAAIVEAMTPVVAILLGFIFMKERFTFYQLFGVLISIIGVLYIITNGSMATLLSLSFNIGDVIMLLAVLSWAVYSILVKQHGHKFTVYGSLLMMLFFAAVTLLILSAVLEWSHGGFDFDWSMRSILGLLYIGIFPAVIALLAWNKAVGQIGPSQASVFLNLIPFFTAVMALVFLQESLLWLQIIGGMLVLLGVYISTRVKKDKTKVETKVE